MSEKYTIVDRLKDGDDRYYVVKGPQGFLKLKIDTKQVAVKSSVFHSYTPTTALSYRLLYKVDPNIQACFVYTGDSAVNISCKKLQGDNGLNKYLTWIK